MAAQKTARASPELRKGSTQPALPSVLHHHPGHKRFDGDPLDLTKKLAFRSELIREAYSVLSRLIRKKGKDAEFKRKSTSERIRILHAKLQEEPKLLEIAADNLSIRHELSKAAAQLKL